MRTSKSEWGGTVIHCVARDTITIETPGDYVIVPLHIWNAITDFSKRLGKLEAIIDSNDSTKTGTGNAES